MKRRIDPYPLNFKPILKSKIWGGNKLVEQLSKRSTIDKLGESWELSGVPENLSEVANGPLKGQDLKQLIQVYQDDLVGKKVYANFKEQFPLLIKFIDAADTLSVQLHPDDRLAQQRHNSFGKTEMWYIVDHEEDGFIIADLKKKLNEEQLRELIDKGQLQQHLKAYPTEKGDTFFISPGLVHAIGKGVLLAEIQQTSDITYRLFDWNRKDDHGNERELHIEDSLEAVDLSLNARPKVNYDKRAEKVELVDNRYFTTSRLNLNAAKEIDLSYRDSFTILINVSGKVEIIYKDKSYSLPMGETMLIPAIIDKLQLVPASTATLLDVHIR